MQHHYNNYNHNYLGVTMAITVEYGKESIKTYPEATKWVIDDNEALHVVGVKGNIASYNRGYWSNVSVSDE